MVDFESMCPICEEDIVIKERDIARAKMHADEAGGLILVGCPNCCRALVIGGEVLKQFEAEPPEDTTWLPCLALEGVVAVMPAGFEEHMGVKEYKPGGRDDAKPRFAYMLAYGIDPACALKKMGR